ncbi:MAG: NTPase [bacterium]
MSAILITGRPGVGKTTFIQNVLKGVDVIAGGFYTREIRTPQGRTGFQIVTLSGKTGELASLYKKSSWRVGKYFVNLADLENIAVREMESAFLRADLVVIDEIGKMELFSEKFRRGLLKILDSQKLLLATVMLHSSPFTDRIKNRSDVQLFEINVRNRELITTKIIEIINNQIIRVK